MTVSTMSLPHWSWKVHRRIYDVCDCLMFHPGDLPLARGGSPLQDLIDAGGHPRAFLACSGYHVEFRDARFEAGGVLVEATVLS